MKTLMDLEIINLKIPFKSNFKHHSAERSCTQSVIVIVNDNSYKGYGESCPREYVTNESIDSVFFFFNQIKPQIIKFIHDLITLQKFKIANLEKIQKNPSAWCAIELALLDLFAKQNHLSIEELLGLPKLNDQFQYSAVLGDDDFDEFVFNVHQYKSLNLKAFKIKISGNEILDHKKLVFITKLIPDISVRLDANNLWEKIEDVVKYLDNLPCPIIGIEEPLKNKHILQLKIMAQQTSVPIILDESFLIIEQLDELLEMKEKFILNIRISKMGGLLNSIAIAQKAVQVGLKVIIGAQVGETSILTRAGLCLAKSIHLNYFAMEGAFGTFLLKHDIVEEPIMFSHEGYLESNQLINPDPFGFGLKIDLSKNLS